jgi:hypothetical protein
MTLEKNTIKTTNQSIIKTVFRRQLLNYPADESSAGVYVSLALGKIFFIL